MKIGSLFSGCGMLDEGVRAALDGEIVWHAENDKAAGRVLAQHYPSTPNLGDVAAIDWSSVQPVDVLVGGFPCQDVSAAGRRAGLADGTRSGLWAHMTHAIDELRPALVVAENVRGLLSARTDASRELVTVGAKGGRKVGHTERALGRVLADLAQLGYDAQWHGIRASDVGAPHERFRVFIVATAADAAHVGHERDGHTRRGWAGLAHSDLAAADADEQGLQGRHVGVVERADQRATRARSLDAARWGTYAAAVARWESVVDRTAPPATELGGKSDKQRLSPLFVEWMMGWPEGWVTDVPGLSWSSQLRLLGNGVVPQQAAAALRVLLDVATA